MAAMFVCPQCGESADEPGQCSQDQGELRDAQGDEHLGLQLGPYRIARLLGAGGMGKVYLAVHPEIGSRVAIKIYSRDGDGRSDLIERFFAEARATNLIGHENIVNVLDINRLDNGRPYLVMEHLRGLPLSKLIGSDKLTTGAISQIILDVLDGLDAAHSHKIVHRDLKPDNIFVSPTGKATLLDFGVAKLVPETMGEVGPTETGTILGTPHYMSPEQAVGDPVDARTDIYSVGVILYECFTGARPFEAGSLYKLLDQHVHETPPSPRSLRPEVSVAMEEIIVRAMAKSPDDRFQSAAEMKLAIEQASQGPDPALSMRMRIETHEEEAHAAEFATSTSATAATVGGPKAGKGGDDEAVQADAAVEAKSGSTLAVGALGKTASTVVRRPKRKLPFLGVIAGQQETKRLDQLLRFGTVAGIALVLGYFLLRDNTVVHEAGSGREAAAELSDAASAANAATHSMPSIDAGDADSNSDENKFIDTDGLLEPDYGKDLEQDESADGVAPLSLLRKAYRLAAGEQPDVTLESISIRGLNAAGRIRLENADSRITFSFHSRALSDLALAAPGGDKVPGSCLLRVVYEADSTPRIQPASSGKCSRVKTIARPFCSMAELLKSGDRKFQGSINPTSKLNAEYAGRDSRAAGRAGWKVSVDLGDWRNIPACK